MNYIINRVASVVCNYYSGGKVMPIENVGHCSIVLYINRFRGHEDVCNKNNRQIINFR